MSLKPFPERVPTNKALRDKKAKDTRKLRWIRAQQTRVALSNSSTKGNK